MDVLFGGGVAAEDLNDDALGRSLDWLYEVGIDTLYPQLAAAVLKDVGDLPEVGEWLGVHADTTKGLPFYGTIEDGNLADPKWKGRDPEVAGGARTSRAAT